ncbi:MAG: hypothetical protein IPG25_19530 [Proteobacteria bacterium]|nr:hypothetical protein [Pseudomonadota bacterium]
MVAVLAVARGGGGGGGTDVAIGGIIGGTGFKGPVASATVTAYAVSGGSPGAQVGMATTDASGKFSLSIGNYSGPVMLQLSGGTYTDEATGTTMNMAAGDVMTAILPTVAAGATISGIQITPVTSMAQTAAQHLSGGMTDANIAAANTAVGTYFMVSDILHVQPMNPLVSGSGSTASQDAINYGMAMAAMSQYARARHGCLVGLRDGHDERLIRRHDGRQDGPIVRDDERHGHGNGDSNARQRRYQRYELSDVDVRQLRAEQVGIPASICSR